MTRVSMPAPGTDSPLPSKSAQQNRIRAAGTPTLDVCPKTGRTRRYSLSVPAFTRDLDALRDMRAKSRPAPTAT
ncbi:hypothetical protein GA0115259_1008112 [Streptomyces sp. MnatMP-M17]|nr:hypothetical protein GA0115259_1008112 [Streptomyces sp. MnatMP-M17]